MEYRTLGKTGLKVSAIGIGTWQLSGPVTIDGKPDGFPDVGRDFAIALIRQCGELGINVIDTAEIYGDGEGERRVGKGIRPDRDRWIVASKFGNRRGDNGSRVRDASPDAISHSLERSLRRMGTDRIDLYLYHASADARLTAASLECLERLREQGKIRFAGVSTNDAGAAAAMSRNGAIDVVLYTHSLLNQPAAMLDLVRKRELGGMVRGVLASGRLTQPSASTTFGCDDIRGTWNWSEDDPLVDELRSVTPRGHTTSSFALRYVLDFDATHTVLLGGNSLERYREAVAVLSLPKLDLATLAALATARSRHRRLSLGQSISRLMRRAMGAARQATGLVHHR